MRVMSAWFPIVHWSLRHQPWCSPCCTGFYRADAPAATGPSITNPGEGVKEGAGGLWIRTLVVLFLLVDLDHSLAQVDPGLHVHAVNTARCPSFSNIGHDNTHQSGQLILNVENHCYKNPLKTKEFTGGKCTFQYMIFFRREEKRDFQSYLYI